MELCNLPLRVQQPRAGRGRAAIRLESRLEPLHGLRPHLRVRVQEQEQRARALAGAAIAGRAVSPVGALADQPGARNTLGEVGGDTVLGGVVDDQDLGARRGLRHGPRRRHRVLGSLVVDDHGADAIARGALGVHVWPSIKKAPARAGARKDSRSGFSTSRPCRPAFRRPPETSPSP